jgi:serine/threonine protein kinase
MADIGNDEWLADYFQPAAEVRDRKQILDWAKAPGHWSGCGKHVKSTDIKGKIHAGDILGEGATARVEKVTFRSVTMARKKIRVRGMLVEQLREEANIMEKLVHRHIVELVGTYTHGQNQLYILTFPAAACCLQGFLDDIEDIRSGVADQEDVIKRFEALGFNGFLFPEDPNNTKSLKRPLGFLSSILGCVTEAVSFIHKNNVRHRDLKPKNILLGPRQVYLADFGVSRDLRDSNHSITDGIAGTRWYLAPEVARGEKHHMSPADIFSLGCVFLAVASVLYSAPHAQYEKTIREADQTKKVADITKYLNDLRQRASRAGMAANDVLTCAPKHLLALIESMLSHDPKARPEARQINDTLYELGGIDQIYHGKCCKKATEYISKLIGR